MSAGLAGRRLWPQDLFHNVSSQVELQKRPSSESGGLSGCTPHNALG